MSSQTIKMKWNKKDIHLTKPYCLSTLGREHAKSQEIPDVIFLLHLDCIWRKDFSMNLPRERWLITDTFDNSQRSMTVRSMGQRTEAGLDGEHCSILLLLLSRSANPFIKSLLCLSVMWDVCWYPNSPLRALQFLFLYWVEPSPKFSYAGWNIVSKCLWTDLGIWERGIIPIFSLNSCIFSATWSASGIQELWVSTLLTHKMARFSFFENRKC